ncbi:MAG: MFS transporter [Prolixibacteraceae bacterium]|nr:MFS transporter [Prolixibacteraceae bacterium]
MNHPHVEMSPKRAYFLIVTVAMALFMVNLDTSIINVALPTMASNFHSDPSDVAKIIISYLLALSSTLLVFGRLGDLKGADKLFMVGYSVFTVGSLLCALAPNLNYLIAFRLLQGLGGAILYSNWGPIFMKYLPPQFRAKAFGAITIAAGSGFAVGPPVGGYLVDHLGWRWVFLINIPFGLFALFSCFKLLNKRNIHNKTDARIDIPGALTSIFMLFSLFFLFEVGPKRGWTDPVSLGVIASFVIFFLLFLFREQRCKSPLIKLNLFKNTTLSFSLISRTMVMLILSGLSFIFPFFFETVRGLSPSQVGLVLMIFPLTSFVGGPLAGKLGSKIGKMKTNFLSLVFLFGSGFLIWTFQSTTSWTFIIMSFIVFGFGLALFLAGNIGIVMGNAPRGNEGMVTAINSVFSILGSALGVIFFQLVYSLHLPNKPGLADHLNASVKALTKGYQYAVLIAIAAAGISLLLAFFLKENKQHNVG